MMVVECFVCCDDSTRPSSPSLTHAHLLDRKESRAANRIVGQRATLLIVQCAPLGSVCEAVRPRASAAVCAFCFKRGRVEGSVVHHGHKGLDELLHLQQKRRDRRRHARERNARRRCCSTRGPRVTGRRHPMTVLKHDSRKRPLERHRGLRGLSPR